jgi:predicted glutamine amidotransferase
MCRWLAYSGAPLYLEQLIFEPEHSIIDQSLSARSGPTTTNGDGFGIGWYGSRDTPGVYRDIQPAWNDANLKHLAEQIRSHMFMAHVRAATGGTPVQQSNCHPFVHGRWLFLHNGRIEAYREIRRALEFAVSPELYNRIEGTTDSEVMFHLALSFGLEEDPVGGLERMVGFVEETGWNAGIEHPMQMTVGLTNGHRLYAVRYSSNHSSRTLYHSRSIRALKALNPMFDRYSDDAIVVVSEPLNDVADYWEEISESSVIVVEGSEVSRRPFRPERPA